VLVLGTGEGHVDVAAVLKHGAEQVWVEEEASVGAEGVREHWVAHEVEPFLLV